MAKQNHVNENTQPRTESTPQGAESSAKDGQAGRGWHGDPDGHAAAGRKGGQKISRDRAYMAQIGKRGGEAVSRNREHMAEIGRRGGQAKLEAGEGEPRSGDSKTGS